MAVEVPRLLITDDDASFRETLREAFQPQGYETLLAGDGEEALQIVRTREVHVVLLDMHMPKLTGLETLRQVKRLRGLLPCILMSAELSERIVEEARQERAYSVLSKPVTMRQLTRLIDCALEQIYNWRRPAR
ncbi:MAG: response regulator [Planctomycetota bacterium]